MVIVGEQRAGSPQEMFFDPSLPMIALGLVVSASGVIVAASGAGRETEKRQPSQKTSSSRRSR